MQISQERKSFLIKINAGSISYITRVAIVLKTKGIVFKSKVILETKRLFKIYSTIRGCIWRGVLEMEKLPKCFHYTRGQY